MEDKGYLVTPEMVYGAEWLQKHADELEKWEWEFRPCSDGDSVVCVQDPWGVAEINHAPIRQYPVIILLRRKISPAPQLREFYGKDSVEIPAHKEWTGELREAKLGESWISPLGDLCICYTPLKRPRLILRDRTPPVKVWYRAEEKLRRAKRGEIVWRSVDGWQSVTDDWDLNAEGFTTCKWLCATRHEEPDLTPTVVTQADVDAAWAKQHGGGE